MTTDPQNPTHSYHSLSRDMRLHKPCLDCALEPAANGSIVHRLWGRGKLTRRQLIAWNKFCDDVDNAEGDSGPLTVSYAERVGTSTAGAPRSDLPYDEDITPSGLAGMRLAKWNPAWVSVDTKWGALRPEERGIIDQLLRDHIRITRGVRIHSHDIAFIGAYLSGYRDDRQAIAAGVSRVQAVLTVLADLYLLDG